MDIDLQSCGRLLQTITSKLLIKKGKQIHLLFLKTGVFPFSITFANRILQMYTRCDYLEDARKLFDEMPQRNCFTWNSLLEGYVKSRNEQESLHLFYAMPEKNSFSWNMIVSMYVKAAKLKLARKFFDEMPMKNGVAWNSMIHGYAENGRPVEALSLFNDVKSGCYGPYQVDVYVLATVFGACTELVALKMGKTIHACVIVNGVEFDSVLGSSVVNMYGKCGDLNNANLVLNSLSYIDDFSLSSLISAYSNSGKVTNAKKIFSLKSNPCVVLWNALISGYIVNNMAMEALFLYGEMRRSGTREDTSTIATVLTACDCLGIVIYGTQMHAHACKFGVIHDRIVASVLIDTYTKCGRPDYACELFSELSTYDTVLLNSMITVYSSCGRIEDAKKVFNNIASKSLISWNSMISGLSQNGYPTEAIACFRELNQKGFKLDRFSLASVISTCGTICSLELGEQLFAKATIIGLESDKIVLTSLVDFYCKCGLVHNGQKIFDQILHVDQASWNSMLMGYATNGYGIEALDLFNNMRRLGVMPTDITFTAVLSVCDHCGLLEEGLKWFHAMKNDYFIDPGIEHYSCMIDLFARVGRLEEAINLLTCMPFDADVSIWSSILRGCLANGDTILGKKVAEKIITIDPKNADAYVQLSSVFATAGNWNSSEEVRKLITTERIQKVPGTSWIDC
ncbi:putative pentatricopeptide repeat-containing protein At1g77010, mitochondrial [Rutidosis leptorrhynchoides]|uniref:putative pentatricopeptide repeat-containing protein At1g77010, mitochondrial n=1 Tax=Rutidosis leptorrhynchoides TaxID=125765 RepID=UPI003A991700